jgi:hypothetical protein
MVLTNRQLHILKFLFIITVVFSLPLTLVAQTSVALDAAAKDSVITTTSQPYINNPLFSDEEVLRFKLVVDYNALLKDRGEERGYHPATISYKVASGAVEKINLKVMVRGNRRRDPTVCRFPPIMLNFPRKEVIATVFGKVNKLKLVTHCVGEDYVLREYLVYKAYNLLTDMSFRVRLCQVEFEDINNRRKSETKYAFLIEDDKDVARRNRSMIVPEELPISMNGTNTSAMAKLAVFQYMIGNTDWSVPYRHNIKLLSQDSLQAPIPVPYDFDYSGIVATPYAVPPPELGITSVRQRLFRGYDFPDSVYTEVINTFNRHRQDIYNVYQNCAPLNKGYRKQTLKYLDNFYETINDPKDFRNNIVRIGQKNQKSYVVVKGLE